VFLHPTSEMVCRREASLGTFVSGIGVSVASRWVPAAGFGQEALDEVRQNQERDVSRRYQPDHRAAADRLHSRRKRGVARSGIAKSKSTPASTPTLNHTLNHAEAAASTASQTASPISSARFNS